MVLVMVALLSTTALGEWVHLRGNAIGKGGKGTLVISNDEIILNTNMKMAFIQKVRINGKEYSFTVQESRKKAILKKSVNKKDYKKVIDSVLESSNATKVAFKDSSRERKEFIITKPGIIKSFAKARIEK